MESFEVTVNTISFSHLTRTIIRGTAVIFAISLGAIQLLLFMPFAAELKAFVFVSFGLFPSLLALAGLAFLTIMIITFFGGTRKFKGILRIANDFNFESKKLKLSFKFQDIKCVFVPQYEDSFNEWMVFAENHKFQLTFEHHAERLRAEEILNKNNIEIERNEP